MRVAQTVLVFALLAGCGEREAGQAGSEPAAVTVRTVVAARRAFRPQFEYPAVIEAQETATIRAQVSGLIGSRHFAPGERVQPGQLLFEIEDADYRSAVQSAEAALQSAEAAAREAESNWQRAKGLKPEGFISQRDYDLAGAQVETTRAAVAQATASLDRARLDLGRTRITAPFAGKVSAARVGVGDYVAPSGGPLCEVVKVDPIYAMAEVDQRLYNTFVQRRATLEREGRQMPRLELSIVLPSGETYEHRGTFEHWDATATETAGTVAGRVLVDNPNGLLLPGTNVMLHGRSAEPIDMILVPQKAVGQDQQGHFLMTVTDGDTVARVNVRMGVRDGADWAVPEGLEEGTRVIVEGLQKVRPGMQVITVSEATE